MAVYAVIDTNVLVSALLKPQSVPRKVIEYALSQELVPLFNDEILAEYQQVLSRPKFHFPLDAVKVVVHRIKEVGLHLEAASVTDILPDPKDVVFYTVTMAARAKGNAYLVTGNIRHFPAEPFVVTPRQMVAIMGGIDAQPQ